MRTKASKVAYSLPLSGVLGLLLFGACTTQQVQRIDIDGSSTVAPISEAIAEDYGTQSDVRVTVGISGTGGGFRRFVTGEIEISNASRPLKDSEAEEAKANGVDFTHFTVAYDGLAVVTNVENDFVSCLSVDQLSRIWREGSEINNWNQVDPSYPDLNIDLYGPDEESGTYDYFNEVILDEGAPRTDYTPSSDDNVLVRGVSGSSGGLGYFGLAFYANSADLLNLVAIDSGAGCVLPDASTVANGIYEPLSRPLFIYVNTAFLEREEVYDFVEYYLENTATIAVEVGYVALLDDESAAQREILTRFR